MRCANATFALTMVVLLCASTTALAQNRGTTGGQTGGGGLQTGGTSTAAGGSSGMFGSRTLGSSLSGGSRGFASGNTGVNGGQGVAGKTQQGDANTGQVNLAGDRFARGNRQPGQFVGSDTSDLPSFLTNLATGGGGNNNNLNSGRNGGRNGGNQNQANANQNNASRGGRTQAVPYRQTRSVAFDVRPANREQLSATLVGRFQRSPRFQTMGPVQVEIQDRTAILRGVVATAHDRDLAERLALLEAGISRVQNELTVAQAAVPPAPEPQP